MRIYAVGKSGRERWSRYRWHRGTGQQGEFGGCSGKRRVGEWASRRRLVHHPNSFSNALLRYCYYYCATRQSVLRGRGSVQKHEQLRAKSRSDLPLCQKKTTQRYNDGGLAKSEQHDGPPAQCLQPKKQERSPERSIGPSSRLGERGRPGEGGSPSCQRWGGGVGRWGLLNSSLLSTACAREYLKIVTRAAKARHYDRMHSAIP